MTAFLLWYLLILLLGWLTFPLVHRLFPALADRGYALARAFGLLVWAYLFWLSASFGIAQNDAGGLLLGLIPLAGFGAWAFVNGRSEISGWVKENRRLILTTEILFLIAFGFMAFARASNPELMTAGGEKWMEEAFINAIMHSPTFPPHDPWLSGYAISYYYFGYVMTAMLAEFTGVPASIAHNLMLSLIFAMSAIGVYGLLYNLLNAYWKSNDEAGGNRFTFRSLLAPLFLLIVSNFEGVFESLHRKGIGWVFHPDGSATSSFWKWMDLRELNVPPAQPLQWAPDQFFWWWRASRVIRDYDLRGNYQEVIDEFPFFSYLLGDLHPHVLSMPFLLLAIAVALNIYLGGWRGKVNLFFGGLKIHLAGFFVIALVLGGLAFLNTWDILVASALIVLSYALARVRESGWGWERIEDVLLLGIPAVAAAYVMYLPFFIGFDSQAGGIVPNFMYPTRGVYLWVAWGTLLIPLIAYLIYLWRRQTPADWRAGILTMLGVLLALLASMFVIGFIALRFKPDLVNPILQSQGLDIAGFISESMKRRLTYIGSLLTLLIVLIPTLSFLFGGNPTESGDSFSTEAGATSGAGAQARKNAEEEKHPARFILLLIGLGALLILGPEFIYLLDNFGSRINTVFKFYYQAWILWSLASAFAAAVLIFEARGLAARLYTVVLTLVIAAGLVYPVFSLPNKTDDFRSAHPEQRTLDGAAYLANIMPDDYRAFHFMQGLDQGVVAEAVGGQYSEYARVATYTGFPTVLGWPGHEGQWRDSSLQGSRQQDIETLYTTPDWTAAQDIIKRYQIRYIYIGNLERSTYPVNEEKFKLFLKPIFQEGSVTIYEVP